MTNRGISLRRKGRNVGITARRRMFVITPGEQKTRHGDPPAPVLLTVAGDGVVPVDEWAVGVVAPSPDVKLKDRANAVAIGAGDELKGLTLEYGRSAVVIFQPGLRVHDVFDAEQVQLTVCRFVDKRFGLSGIDQAVGNEWAIDVVDAHGTVVRTADAAKKRSVAGPDGGVHVLVLPRGVADNLDEFGRHGGVSMFRRTSLHQRHGKNQASGERQA